MVGVFKKGIRTVLFGDVAPSIDERGRVVELAL